MYAYICNHVHITPLFQSPTHPTKTQHQDWLIFSGQGISCGGGLTPADAGAKYMIALTVFLILFLFIGTCW